jgi:putative transposase
MERFNAACDAIAEVAFREKTANKIRLQKVVYAEVRSQYGLSAQMTVRAISKVCEAYKRDKKIQPTFRPLGAISYDQRNMSWKGVDRVSLLTLHGREIFPFVVGQYQEQRLKRIRGQVDLIYRDDMFFLAVVADVPEPPPERTEDFLGVDLGVTNIAADSDGNTYSGAKVNGLRARHAELRTRLQAKGTKSAKRLLKKRRRKESRFAADVNHTISKRLVAKAKGTSRGIAMEDLQGIRDRVTVKKAQRRKHHSWSFHQLRSFVQYKAVLAGIPVVLVDPRNTSRTCPNPECGCIDKRNRPTRDRFLCISCGHAGPADSIAATNIRVRAGLMSSSHTQGDPAPASLGL